MDLNKIFEIGMIPIAVVAILGTIGDLLAPSIITFVIVPLELAVIFYFGHLFAKAGKDTVQCAVASAVVAGIAIVINAILLVLAILVGGALGFFHQMDPGALIAMVIGSIIISIPIFAIAGAALGAIAQLVSKRM